MRWTLALLPLLASVIPAMAQDNDDDDNDNNNNNNDASYPQTVLTALEWVPPYRSTLQRINTDSTQGSWSNHTRLCPDRPSRYRRW